MRHAIEDILDHAVIDGVAPGLTAAARLPSGETVEAAAGVRGLADPAVMSPDTVFWIASLTKAITTAAALQLVEAGKIALDDPVAQWSPALAAPKVLERFDAAGAPVLRRARAPVTLRHLLTHTSGLAYAVFHADLARYAAASGAASGDDAILMFEPGAGWTYGTGLDFTGQIVEAVSGEPLADYLAAHVFGPLGMDETSFAPRTDQKDRLAAMSTRLDDGALAPRAFEVPPPPNPSMGGGGLFSTAGDYLKFLDAILAGGGPILQPATVAAMRGPERTGPEVGVLPGVNKQLSGDFDPFPGMAKQWGLGFVINPAPGPSGRSAGSLAWAGLANCYYWADPATGVAGVLCSQVLPFADERVLATFAAFERAVYGRS